MELGESESFDGDITAYNFQKTVLVNSVQYLIKFYKDSLNGIIYIYICFCHFGGFNRSDDILTLI
jgi:hypothetical protein